MTDPENRSQIATGLAEVNTNVSAIQEQDRSTIAVEVSHEGIAAC